ncbi:MAG: deoxyribose-phosphate aldolase [Actinobacteria bacterium]|nr:deoxyribose-phosphate aldolase [Actinomycetota bacterium]
MARYLQHTNVRPDATRADIERLLEECATHRFDGAMVNPIWVPLARTTLAGTGVKVCTALDFPMGGATAAMLAAQAEEAVGLGADQIDVMSKPGWLRSGMPDEYREAVAAVVGAAGGRPVKVMLEAALITDDELARAVELSIEAGAAFVKNSSGYGGGDATPELVRKLSRLAAGRVAVKASGGIRNAEHAGALIDAGASLLGSSASVAIVAGGQGDRSY